ncbi:hypothetical protein [Polaribacter sp. Hel1_85]|uniref:hypothetical protein n=1 Tax=Polaribacter sp. Hel1_85 TaxID=1250005 RepID=UPI00052D9BA0|nr:hypothetical protein [Polaribacter sp. Hel1_85]KGL61860.1 hypothetical protein PHEL85_1645 [Polaribacter sp. Hel1_85]
MEIKHNIDSELFSVFQEIKSLNLDLENWSLIEISDQFQTSNYCGGFDATENEFTFSYFDENKKEYWFQLPIIDIEKIVEGINIEVYMRKAEDY